MPTSTTGCHPMRCAGWPRRSHLAELQTPAGRPRASSFLQCAGGACGATGCCGRSSQRSF
jgi:hypothetical protein